MQLNKTTVEQTILQQFGLSKVKKMLKQLKGNKCDGVYIAVNRYRGGVLFFEMNEKYIWCDYLDQKGFKKTHYKSYGEIFNDLRLLGYFHVEVSRLESELEKTEIEDQRDEKPVEYINSRVSGLRDSLTLRSENDHENSDYWRGQRDTLETVQFIINEVRHAC
ncbi:hypothetical protein [Acinetobacter sp. CFCC 10889]|uniref:hypothetical protein n=1 Tax=Acinetobacter sp. CFCC 10889 TaxID=1775557 RepID=UPI000DD0A170|nr:hypothetical protein [Acinetobacter sp. CFCC 10889]